MILRWAGTIFANLIFGAAIGIGGLLYYQHQKADEFVEHKKIEVVKTVFVPMKRKLTEMTDIQMTEKIYAYDNTPITFNYRALNMEKEYTLLRINYSHVDVSGYEDIKIPVMQTANWKFYIGAGTVGAAVGGYLVYKVARR